MAIFIFDERAMFYHLGANSTEQMKSNNNAIYAIFESAFDFAYNKGIPLCYLGGGVEENDELFAFKKQFASFITPCYIGGVIYNKEIYEELKEKNNAITINIRFTYTFYNLFIENNIIY